MPYSFGYMPHVDTPLTLGPVYKTKQIMGPLLFKYVNMSVDTLIGIVEMLLEESVTLTRQTRKRKLEEKLDQITVVTSQVGK